MTFSDYKHKFFPAEVPFGRTQPEATGQRRLVMESKEGLASWDADSEELGVEWI